jgi:hypothetical protein
VSAFPQGHDLSASFASRRRSRVRQVIASTAAALLLSSILGVWSSVVAEDDGGLPLAVTHERWTGIDPLIGSGSGAGASGIRNFANPICSTATSGAANVNTDCEGNNPHNETAIAVNPTNALNIIGGANDYQLNLSSGGTVYETIYSRAHVTFDGGATWTSVGIDQNAYTATGDPALAFDADGRAYYAMLGFGWSQNIGCCRNPDIVVATSTDGGNHWSALNRVASGAGYFTSTGVFNDKEYVTAWGHGNAIVTWTRFNQGPHGSYLSSPIYASVTHDGGKTWSTPGSVSGSAAFCADAAGGTNCEQDQFSTPVVAADGSIYVSFINYSNTTDGRDQYLVVKLDPASGARVGGPWAVGSVVDGFTDYPLSIDGRQTLQDSQFRTNAIGNVAADPTDADHLAMAWSDMRNSTLPAPADPYAASTNSDVVVSQSWDGGATWSAPAAVSRTNDQFQPWAVYDSTGKLRIGFFDRSYDGANHSYGYSLATETAHGSLAFTVVQLTTALSDPTQGTRWFSGRTPNASFPHPTTFLGDYAGMAPTAAGGIVALWTDLRLSTCFAGRCGTGEDAFFASHG